MEKKKDVFYSLPEVWDFCLDKIYNKKQYVEGFIELMKKRGITKKSLILDAGCGFGFPAIDLIGKGYHVIGADKSSEMVRQIKINAQKRGITVEACNIMWGDLAKKFGPAFDFIYCRGNSLVYAASWEQNWIVPSRSREEIQRAVQNFYRILKPNGQAYVDVTNKNEKPHKKSIGIVRTGQGPVEIIWEFGHDAQNRIRTWTSVLKFLKTGKEKKYHSYSYLLPHEDLVGFFTASGFRKIDKYVPVKGENNYNAFIAKK